jgi:hypothetical protein
MEAAGPFETFSRLQSVMIQYTTFNNVTQYKTLVLYCVIVFYICNDSFQILSMYYWLIFPSAPYKLHMKLQKQPLNEIIYIIYT